jgi:hypothetical protein
MYDFEELDETTRKWMLEEFKQEISSRNPYRSKGLTELGWSRFVDEMEAAIRAGNEESLAAALCNAAYWQSSEQRVRKGRPYTVSVDPRKAAQRLAYSEFNTWYVRGFARRLLEEGVANCQVYRAAPAIEPRPECSAHEGQVYSVQEIYDGHRAKYWPSANPNALSIPCGPYCHHTIRRH